MNTELEDNFAICEKLVTGLKNTPTDEELLELYSLYKQKKFGDCDIDISSLSMFDFKGKKKANAWMAKKGMSRRDACEKYIDYAYNLINKYD